MKIRLSNSKRQTLKSCPYKLYLQQLGIASTYKSSALTLNQLVWLGLAAERTGIGASFATLFLPLAYNLSQRCHYENVFPP